MAKSNWKTKIADKAVKDSIKKIEKARAYLLEAINIQKSASRQLGEPWEQYLSHGLSPILYTALKALKSLSDSIYSEWL